MHLFQVGVGSGGMVVLDLLARDRLLDHATIIDPDFYLPHNLHRHAFPQSGMGRLKVDLAADWLSERRPDLEVTSIAADLTDPNRQLEFNQLAASCDLGLCAADNESAKYCFDALMRNNGKPWTLGEVLSGGIGGWVHRFFPGGPCYGCVASHLQRTVVDEPPTSAPDYSNPGAALAETSVPASKASIEAIASLHALITLEVMASPRMQGERESGVDGKPATNAPQETYTSLLFTLRAVPGVFEEAYRSYRFVVPRAPDCLVCSTKPMMQIPDIGENLDVALDQALDRLAPK